jgi:hypothetical protein
MVCVLRIWDTGSGAFLIPGSGIGFFQISEPGSPILDPQPIFLELSDNFSGKKYYTVILCQLAGIFFLHKFKNKIIYIFVKFVATKKGRHLMFPSPLFVAVVGCGMGDLIRDPGSKIWVWDPGSRMHKN